MPQVPAPRKTVFQRRNDAQNCSSWCREKVPKRGAHLLVEHRLSLPTETHLLRVVPPLALGERRGLAGLVLGHLLGRTRAHKIQATVWVGLSQSGQSSGRGEGGSQGLSTLHLRVTTNNALAEVRREAFLL